LRNLRTWATRTPIAGEAIWDCAPPKPGPRRGDGPEQERSLLLQFVCRLAGGMGLLGINLFKTRSSDSALWVGGRGSGWLLLASRAVVAAMPAEGPPDPSRQFSRRGPGSDQLSRRVEPPPRHFHRQVGESLCSAQVLISMMFRSLPTCSPPLLARTRRQQRVSTSRSHVEKLSATHTKVPVPRAVHTTSVLSRTVRSRPQYALRCNELFAACCRELIPRQTFWGRTEARPFRLLARSSGVGLGRSISGASRRTSL